MSVSINSGADPGFQVRSGGALKNIASSGGRRENCWVLGSNPDMASLYINIFLTCPFEQPTKKSTCPTQSFSCPKKKKKL
jgi:hypothetical protein